MFHKYSPIVLLAFCSISSAEEYFEGPFLGNGIKRAFRCPSSTPRECRVESVQEAGISCDRLLELTAAVDPQLYRGGYGVHLVPMAHRYYYSRANQAFGSCCPTCLNEIQELELATTWTGAVGGSAYAQAWDVGYENRAFRKNCSFPTEEFPFVCTGVDGTRGVVGKRLGVVYYTPLLTNDAREGRGVWSLFGQCWDVLTPTRPNGSNSPVSWNVFSKEKTISAVDRELIRIKLEEIGFPTARPVLLENTFP